MVGFVHVRDMFELEPEDRQNETLFDLFGPFIWYPETKPVSDLLRDMQHDAPTSWSS